MTRFLIYIFLLALLASFAGCSDEDGHAGTEKPGAPDIFCLAVSVPGNSLKTRAQTSEPGKDYENRINSFSLFVFRKKDNISGGRDITCVFCQRIDLTGSPADPDGWVTDGVDGTRKNITIPIRESAGWADLPLDIDAAYDFYVLANLPATGDPASDWKSDPGRVTLDLLRKFQLTGAARLLNLNDGTAAPVTDDDPLDAIPMSGVSQLSRLTASLPPVEVELTRVVAKVRYTVSATDAFTTEYAPELNTANTVTMLEQSPVASYLFPDWDQKGLDAPTVGSDLKLNTTNIPLSAGAEGWFYVFEDLPVPGQVKPEKPVVFTLSVPTKKGGFSQTQRYTIPVNDSLSLKRNTIYNLDIKLVGPGNFTTHDAEIKTTVQPWEEEIIEDKEGITPKGIYIAKVIGNPEAVGYLTAHGEIVNLAVTWDRNNAEGELRFHPVGLFEFGFDTDLDIQYELYYDGELIYNGAYLRPDLDIKCIPFTSERYDMAGDYAHCLGLSCSLPDYLPHQLTCKAWSAGKRLYVGQSIVVASQPQRLIPEDLTTIEYMVDDYPKVYDDDMPGWLPPVNAPVGTVKVLKDTRPTDGRQYCYRVKLMPDGKWWMVDNMRYWPVAPYEANAQEPLESKLSVSQYDAINNVYGVCFIFSVYYQGIKNMDFPSPYLYNMEAATQIGNSNTGVCITDDPKKRIRGICPDGWHLPTWGKDGTPSEWGDLIRSIDESDTKKQWVKSYFFPEPGFYPGGPFDVWTGGAKETVYASSCRSSASSDDFSAIQIQDDSFQAISVPTRNGLSVRCVLD